ncbi:Fur family transcriptional regulator [Desulfopila sp. IMCC35008]|uniref:Fur family transcriptional regulator n=1 Tax=Desulfopila sp. IMCC35008 TaxID=2653858 RepID=UPI0013D76ABD|nr:transcriptional repressor [Desulfopila sp. IMCC35008]
MCDQCDYSKLLDDVGLDATPNRLHVLEVIGSNNYPLTAAEVFATIDRSHSINRVTVYRILDLLVEKKILEQISSGGRAAHFGLAPNEHHMPHPHFYCTNCGMMECLSPDSLAVRSGNFLKYFSGTVSRIEVRVEGLCRSCVKQ